MTSRSPLTGRGSVLSAALSTTLLSTLMASGNALAAQGSPDFLINNAQATFASMDILAGEEYTLKYNGGYSDCTDVAWHITRPGQAQESLGTSTTVKTKQFRKGDYALTLTTQGQGDKRWFFNLFGCKNTKGAETRTVSLHMDEPGLTQTEHPIMLIPGVLGYDRIALLNLAYFFEVGDELNKYSDQKIVDVSLDPWQNTEDRGADLAAKVVTFLLEQGELSGDNRVNLIAHSHGTTTSRMALHILASEFDNGYDGTGSYDGYSPVASLTSVAGPHYGTPTADGTQWGIENWDRDSAGGIFIHSLMWLLGDFGTEILNLVTGDLSSGGYAPNEYPEQGIYDVVADFTQKGMLRFNACYPSAGIARADDAQSRYFLEQNLPGKEANEVFGYSIVKNASQTQASVQIDDCRDFAADTGNHDFNSYGQRSVNLTVNLASKPDDAYGKDIPYATPENSSGVYGDGLGNPVGADYPGAIRYYSFTGKSSADWHTHPLDAGDAAMGLFLATHQLAGAQTDEGHFLQWIAPVGLNIITNILFPTPLSLEGIVTSRIEAGDSGYRAQSDSFIPVDSSRFGEYLGAYDKWNHLDEINGFFGMVSGDSDDPLAVYRSHANRLQNGGL
jgi:triacylglycerol esterase/lipase EstA (alpha/beta hydrolase family)